MKTSLVVAIVLLLTGIGCFWMLSSAPGILSDQIAPSAVKNPDAQAQSGSALHREPPVEERARAISLTVQILNRFDGRPIKGATVTATGLPGERTSDARGLVVIACPTGMQTLTLTARHPSFETNRLPVRLGDEDSRTQVKLRGRGQLTGTVTGAGRPLLDATVSVDGDSAQTDSQGRFSLSGLRIAAERLVVVERTGFTTQRIALSIAANSTLDVDLKSAPTMQLTVTLADPRARKLKESPMQATVRLGSHVVFTNSIYFRSGIAVQTIPWRDAPTVDVLLRTPLGQTVRGSAQVDQKKRRAHVVVSDLRWLTFELSQAEDHEPHGLVKIRTQSGTAALPVEESTQRVLVPIRLPWPEGDDLRMWTASGVSAATNLKQLEQPNRKVALGDLGGRLAIAPVTNAQVQDFDLRGRRGEHELPRVHDAATSTLRYFVPPGDFMLLRKGEPVDNSWKTVVQGQETRLDLAARESVASIQGQVGQQSRVVLYRRVKLEGRPVELGQQDVTTDECFDFAELSPGDYLVVVKASPLQYRAVPCSVEPGKTIDLGLIDVGDRRILELQFVHEDLQPASQQAVSWTQRPVGQNPDLDLHWDAEGRCKVSVDAGQQTILLSTMMGFGICAVPAGARDLQVIIPRGRSRTFHQRGRAVIEIPREAGACQQLCLVRKLGPTLWFVVADHQGERRFSISKSTDILGLLAYTTKLGAVPLDYTPGTPVELPTRYALRGLSRGPLPSVRLEGIFGHTVSQSPTTLLPRVEDGVVSVYLARGCSAVFNTKEGVEHSVRAQNP